MPELRVGAGQIGWLTGAATTRDLVCVDVRCDDLDLTQRRK